jgi:hypothetical protein
VRKEQGFERKEGKMRSKRRRNWLIGRIAVGLAVAAFVAPVAQARIDEGIQGQPVAPQVSDSSYIPFVTDFPAGLSSVKASGTVVRPDDRVQPRPIVSDKVLVADPAWDRKSVVESDNGMPRAMPSDYAVNPANKVAFDGTKTRSVGSPQAVSTGFDWSDAGIGAGLALGLILLAFGAALATRHLGREQTA